MRRKHIRLYRVVLPLVLLLVSAITPAAASAASTNITTSPTSLSLSITPGTSKTTTLQLLNNGAQPQTINVGLQNFAPYGGQGQATVQPFAKNDPAQFYVHFSQTSFVAKPGVWVPITMTINLPKTAQLGYYYAVIFKPVLPAPFNHTGNTLTASNAVLILVDTNSANEVHKVSLASFNADKKLYDYLPVTFNVSVRNDGNIYLAPRGEIIVSRDSEFHKVLASMEVNGAHGNVLPSSSRDFTAEWQDGFPVYTNKMLNGQPVVDASGKTVQQLKWDFSQIHKFRFGKYYAHLILVYNNGVRDIPIESSLSFWVIPWVTLLVMIVVGLILIMGIALIFWLFFRGGSRFLSSPKKRRKAYRSR